MYINQKKRGFTLIELLVVIAIIGVLSSVVLASLNTARQKSRDAKRQADLKQLQIALELYFDSNSSYPANATASTITTPLAGLVSGSFIGQLPADPLSGRSYYYVTNAAPATQYCIGASLEGNNTATPTLDTCSLTGLDGAAACGTGLYCSNRVGQ